VLDRSLVRCLIDEALCAGNNLVKHLCEIGRLSLWIKHRLVLPRHCEHAQRTYNQIQLLSDHSHLFLPFLLLLLSLCRLLLDELADSIQL